MQHNYRLRLRIVVILVVVIGLLLASKLFLVQVIQGEAYYTQADRQYVTPADQVFERGTIFFTDKHGERISAATLKSGFKLAIVPKNITDADTTFLILDRLIGGLDHTSFVAKASKTSDPYEEIITRLDQDQAETISEQDLSGVHLYKEKWRFYPAGSAAAQTVGFVSWHEDTLRGQYGLERQYDGILSRTSPELYVNFFAEVFSNISRVVSSDEEEQREGDIITTLEPSVQLFLDNQLQDIQETWNTASASGMVMDPKTGAIIAMGTTPSFDLNSFSRVDKVSVYRNPLIEDVYEMGSIIKPLVMAIGLDTGVLNANTSYTDHGKVTVRDYTIWNFDREGRGPGTTMQEVLSQSLNTGMVFAGDLIGKKDMKKYLLEGYQLGEKTGIDLPNEVTGLVRNFERGDVEYANLAFGQGMALSPITTVRALASLGNGGVLVTPHLVSAIDYTDGFTKSIDYVHADDKDVTRIIKPETSDEITRMLVKVIDEELGGGAYALENYSVAAKTGTAQIPHPEGGYYDDRNRHSFFGYFPAYDPEFLVFFTIDHPKGVRYASQTLTEPFMDTTKFLISYYDVVPDR